MRSTRHSSGERTSALRATNADVFPALKSGGRSLVGSGKGATRGLLVVLESALGLIVVASAVLFGRTLVNLQAVNPGFDAAHVLTIRLYLQQVKYPTESDVTSFFKRLDTRLTAVPRVTATSLSISPPLSGLFVSTDVTPEAASPVFRAQAQSPSRTTATPGYFRALGMRLVSGRAFEDRDMAFGAPAPSLLRSNHVGDFSSRVEAHLLDAIGLASAKGICHHQLGFINRIANRCEPLKGGD